MFEILLGKGVSLPVVVGGFALQAGGIAGGSTASSTEKYAFVAETTSAGASLTTAQFGWAGAGNKDFGFVMGNGFGRRYTFASDVVATVANVSDNRTDMAGAGGATKAYFSGGRISSTRYAYTARYIYATEARLLISGLTQALNSAGGASNGDTGVIAGGIHGSGYSNVMHRYLFSNDALSSGSPTLAEGRHQLVGASSATVAIFCSGTDNANNKITDLYTYASNTRVTGVNAINRASQGGGASYADYALFAGGNYQGVATEKFLWSNSTYVVGTSLSATRYAHTGLSSAPPGNF